MSYQDPLTILSPVYTQEKSAYKKDCIDKCKTGCDGDNTKRNRGNVLGLILWFVIIAVIAGIILALWKPTIVQKDNVNGNPTGELDTSKVVVGALIISLIIVIIIYLVMTASKSR